MLKRISILAMLALTISTAVWAAEIAQGGGSEEVYPSAPLGLNEVRYDAKTCESGGMVKAGPLETPNQAEQLRLRSEFLTDCAAEGIHPSLCENLTHPNNNSKMEFRCTFPSFTQHVLLPNNRSLWTNGFQGAKAFQEALEEQGLEPNQGACPQIYNYYRPEPYNANVGGAAGRHPNGTAVDVEFCTKEEAQKALNKFAKMRMEKRINSIGIYSSGIRIHIGFGTEKGNTWNQGSSLKFPKGHKSEPL